MALIIWLTLKHFGIKWLHTSGRWAERTLFTATLFFISWAAWFCVVVKSRYFKQSSLVYNLSLLSYVALVLGAYYIYRHLKPDLFPLALTITSIIVIDTSFIANLIKNPITIFFFLSFLVIAQATAGVYWLLQLNIEPETES